MPIFNEQNIPAELKALPNWVGWRKETREGKDTKVPYQAQEPWGYAKSNDSSTWVSFDTAIKNIKKFDGLGFVTTLDCGVILFDLDHSIVDGEVLPWAHEAITIAQSYTEISQSKTGYHIYFKGKLPGTSKKVVDAEIYNSGRFFTVTGDIDFAYQYQFRQIDDEIVKKLYDIVLSRGRSAELKIIPKPTQINSDVLERMFASRNGADIRALFNGDLSKYSNDQSAADSALCFHLAFWTGKNIIEIDRLFRSSSLMRDKWDKKHASDGRTYGQMTIERAISLCNKSITDTPRITGIAIDGRDLNETQSTEVSITRPIDHIADVEYFYINGHIGGYLLPWVTSHRYLQITPNFLYVFTGFPGDGKTEFMLNIAVHLAKKHKLKWAIYSPENYPAKEILSNLLEKGIGKSFFGLGKMSLEEIKSEMYNFLNEHFFLLGVENETVSLDGLIKAARTCNADGLIIDPYNTVESTRPVNMSLTEFVGHNLLKLQRYSKQDEKIVFVSAHPTKTKKNDDGTYACADLYDIADSAHWRNKCDFGIVVYRNRKSGYTDIHIKKVKQKRYGTLGEFSLQFDPQTGSFSENEELINNNWGG